MQYLLMVSGRNMDSSQVIVGKECRFPQNDADPRSLLYQAVTAAGLFCTSSRLQRQSHALHTGPHWPNSPLRWWCLT